MKYRNDLKKRILAGLLAGAALCLASPAAQAANVIPNTQLPTGGQVMAGNVTLPDIVKPGGNPNGATSATITQNSQNAVIKWDSFNIGANATVTFQKGEGYTGNGNFNTLNYDISGSMSQIYGTINAQGGNIYIVNPNGVEIGNSAQINTGSLYVSNKNLDDKIYEGMDIPQDMDAFVRSGQSTDAALMSLGNINANTVTFEGSRIVIDTERIKDESGDNKLVDIDNGQNITIRTTNENNVVIGYKGYDEDKKAYNTQEVTYNVTKIDEKGNVIDDAAKVAGYMWVEDVEQLQAIGASADTLKGNYALRNSIDATATQDWTGTFNPLGGTGQNGDDNPFTGKFDGLDYNIFNLNINRADENNVGLFGVVGSGAVINNVTLVGGSITGQSYVGSLAGTVQKGAHISNITNSAGVNGIKTGDEGGTSIGGIIGQSNGGEYTNLVNTGTVTGDTNNIGGLIGNMSGGSLGGTSYNLGAVTAKGYNVGGLVGNALNAVIGDGEHLVYNRLNVTGAYNVGGIVGNMEGTQVYNAENSGNVLADQFMPTNSPLYKQYEYHTDHPNTDNGDGNADGLAHADAYIANVGGIAGSSSGGSLISGALNLGDVSSSQNGDTYYVAGNVGGVVGSAVDTNITNATNRENEIRGAHNVGGIAGYFASSDNADKTYTISNGINDGGDIMATGARNKDGFVTETIRRNGGESFFVGNMGGIVGYMDGDKVFITGSANRGTVHTHEPEDSSNVQDYEKAANVGGIVGKIDRSSAADEQDKQDIRDDYSKAAVSNSYNTGDVMGYTGVGGIAGMMYNGEIAGSYNLGYLRTTRQSTVGGSIDALNMGGIVGDTTETSSARVFLYDVYNKGQIGDSEFNYFGRHVGGIVGRLSGDVEKAYNTGAIYNGYNVVGGIAGWMYVGNITDAFNTGNITVVNRNNGTSQVGGIVGAASTSENNIGLKNVYNLGTLRSFQGSTGINSVGGILGIINGYGTYHVSISNAYTTGNIWAGTKNTDGTYSEDQSNAIRSIWGRYEGTATADNISTTNTYYIRPDDGLPFTDLSANNRDNSNKAIDFDKKDNIVNGQYENQYTYTDETGTHSLGFSTQNGGDVVIEDGEDWRIYQGSTPILNAFLPNAEKYFSDTVNNPQAMDGISSIQYGTAYDPLLTIVNAAKDTANLTFNWQDLGINNDAGLAVYGAGLTLNDFMATGGSGYFGGLIYSDGALNINAHTSGETHDEANTNVTGNVALGSASELYGSSVAINADGQVTIYGSVTATGNTQDGTSWDETQKKYTGTIDATDGSISITGGNVDVYGQLTSAKDKESVRVPGINGMAEGWNPAEHENVADPNGKMSDIGDRFGYTTGASAVTGNISITANDAEDGHVNVYYGNKGEGIVTTGGDLTVTASGDVYMDSDLSIGGDLSLKAGYKEGEDKPAAGSEAVLDISNIGQVRANGDEDAALSYLNEFLTHFADGTHNITLGGDKTKIAVDMWGDGAFDLTKYDYKEQTLAERINALHLVVNGTEAKGQDYTYIWVSTGEQLAGIQQYYEQETNAGRKTNILSYNFALKNDIDASNVRDYKAIGTGSAYTGTFDGRDNRIIGLTMTGDNAGIFDTIGKNADGTQVGTVEDLRVYSGTFSGTSNAGAVAGVNNGKISNVTAFGNVVDVNNQTGNDSSYAGGIAGTNSGSIDNASAIGTATADGQNAIAGGIAGTNTGKISDSSANSAVNASAGNATALGGVAGVNEGTLDNVDSLGVTTGVYKVEGKDTLYSDNVGGIAGTNSGTVTNVYNESIVSGRDNVGGIFGENSGTDVSNVANAADVTGEAGDNDTSDYVGGLAGSNSGSITNGRNNGEITGNNYVGGLVGSNGANSTLTNLVNDSAAAITGDNYVGGIAGSNAGTISAENQTNLINRGSITGQNYVGGVAGENIGTIEYVKSDINLNVRYKDQDAKYFGGVAGINGKVTEDGTTINIGTITNATNTADIIAPDADFVGGIVGWNTSAGKLEGMGNSNEGRVEGASHVGGVAGLNEADIKGTVDAMVGIENSGVVIAHKGGAGGIFGENTGAISHTELTNNGIVSGTYSDEAGENGTGGIFGVNSGDVTYSSLKNEIGGQVMGTQNVGGLIGVNSGNITGGRTEADNTDVGDYKYQIYNNGTIKAGTWNDADQDGVVDEGEFTEATTNSQNIAGLFGTNSGEVTAGYNTGAVLAGNSTNVGGIAGTNAGKLDQVFNTVITGVNEDGSTASGSITGSTSVGGIAGTNNGTISNAYNTTTVTGTAADAVSGSIAGVNDNFISNVYGSENGKLVASDNLVDSGNGTVSNVYDSENGTFGEGGSAIDKTGGANASTTPWRQYGDNNPILKVFLTTVIYNPYENDQHLVYNGQDQTLNITGNGFWAADQFVAHNSVTGGLIYHDVTGEHKNAGSYTDNLWSEQIKASNTDGIFNPNHLGYDVQSVEYNIDQKELTISLNDVTHGYGTPNLDGYGFTVNGWIDGENYSEDITLSNISDGALRDDTHTKDVNGYNWTADATIGGTLGQGGAGNYKLASTSTTNLTGKSTVTKADLNITAGNNTIHVGDTPHFSGTDISSVLVNGDTISDGSYQYGTAQLPADTSVPGDSVIGIHFGSTYLDGSSDASAWDSVMSGLFKNYNVTFTPGTLTVLALPDGMPDIPEIPGIENHWNGLLGDNPWDRNRDFRERKAEIHYIAGGMTL